MLSQIGINYKKKKKVAKTSWYPTLYLKGSLLRKLELINVCISHYLS